MSTVGCTVVDSKTLLLSAFPTGVDAGKIGYARFVLSDGTRGSVTGAFKIDLNVSPPTGFASRFYFQTENDTFTAGTANHPNIGLLTYPAVNWIMIVLVLALAYYVYHRK
jgi:hypothetical protein